MCLCSPSVHAAVLAINEAVERGVAEDTLVTLQNPSALLVNVQEPLATIYQELLAQAKMEKAANARNRVRRLLRVVKQSWGETRRFVSCLSGALAWLREAHLFLQRNRRGA